MSRLAVLSPRFRLALIVAIYLFLAVGFGVVNPLFEAPDEHHHYFTAQYIADHGRLPVVDADNEWIGQEAAQPPLYYWLGSLFIGPIDTSAAEDWFWLNPFVRLGDASWPNNWNAFVHSERENWPWRGPVLAAHLLRLFSTVLGAGTLYFIYGTARLIWPAASERWLLATAIVAFLPQYAFLHGSVTNDPLVILLCAAGLWQLVRLWLQPLTAGRLLLLGVTAGLAALSKTAGLLLILYSGFILLLLAWRDERWRDLGRAAFYFLLPALLLAGWLYARNWLLYGDPTAANQFVQHFGGRRDYGLLDVLGESRGLWLSLFAVFGWFNLRPPDWVYWLWHGLVLAAITGAIKNYELRITNYDFSLPISHFSLFTSNLRNSLRQPQMIGLLLFGWLLLVYAGLVRFMLLTPAAQGRLLFPALVPLALAMAYGLSCWRRPWVTAAVPMLALLTSIFSLSVVIPRAYTAPQPVERWPATAVILNHDLGQGIELVAVDLETTAVQPGDSVWVTIYSRRNAPPPALAQANNAPELVIDIFGAQLALVGKLQSYHGRGLYPANRWPEGVLFADRLRVDLSPEMVTPVEAWLDFRLARESQGLRIGAVKVTPQQWPAARPEQLADFGGQIVLTAGHLFPAVARPGEQVAVTVMWQATADPGRDLTVFFHLGEPTAPPLAQGDSPPRDGSYPTRLWSAGEVVADWYTLVLPADLSDGRYPLWLGFYDPVSGERLPVWLNGERQPFDAYPVGSVIVSGSSP